MAGSFPEGFIIDLLKRAGHEPRSHSGVELSFNCVFHNESNPSLRVNKVKNVYKCWSCGAQGGVVDMAKQLNVELGDGYGGGAGGGGGKKKSAGNDDWKAYAEALWSSDGGGALDLLHARGFKDDTLKRFHIGVSFKLEDTERGGNFRITIPIFDDSGAFLYCRRYHPEGKNWVPILFSLVIDASKISQVEGTDKHNSRGACPKCSAEVKITKADTETEIVCQACAANIFVHGKPTKIAGPWQAPAVVYGAQKLLAAQAAAKSDPEGADRLVFLCEGEWDRIMVEQQGFTAVTGTSGATTWKEEWTPLFDGLDVVILYDADSPGIKGAEKVRKSLHARGRCHRIRIPKWPFPEGSPFKDVCDWFGPGKANKDKAEFVAFVDLAESLDVGTAAAGFGGGSGDGDDADGGDGDGHDDWDSGDDDADSDPTNSATRSVDSIRDKKKLAKYLKLRQMSSRVRKHLLKRGKFMATRQKDLYFFDNETKKLYTLYDREFEAFINNFYRLNPIETEYRYIKEDLTSYAIEHSSIVNVRRFCHYEPATNCVYISQFNGNVAKISSDSVEIVFNGSDGVIFLDNMYMCDPWEFGGDQMVAADGVTEIMKYLTDINFDETHCEVQTQQKLMFLWLISLFFGSAIEARPLCTCLGTKGSGKTFALKRIVKLLYGPQSDVTSVRTQSPDDLQAAIMANHLVVFDNVDQETEFVNDELAKIATGAAITRRELYTTLSAKTFKPDVFVAITTHRPHFTRNDVIDRMLLFRMIRRPRFGNPSFGPEDRNRFFSALVPIFQSVLIGLANGMRPKDSPYRMSEWSTMAFAIGISLGWNEVDVDETLARANDLRTDLMGEEDPLVGMIQQWLDEDANRLGKPYRATELAHDWNTILDRTRTGKYRWAANWVGRRIADAKEALQRRWTVEINESKNKMIPTTYVFLPIKSDAGRATFLNLDFPPVDLTAEALRGEDGGEGGGESRAAPGTGMSGGNGGDNEF